MQNDLLFVKLAKYLKKLLNFAENLVSLLRRVKTFALPGFITQYELSFMRWLLNIKT